MITWTILTLDEWIPDELCKKIMILSGLEYDNFENQLVNHI